MVLKYLNWIVLLGIIQCWWFTTRAALLDITINGSSSRKTTLKLRDTPTVTCTVTSNRTASTFYVQRNSKNIKDLGSSNTGTMKKAVTCDDNGDFRCYARIDGDIVYSASIQVTVECPPTLSETVQEPVVIFASNSEDKLIQIDVPGHPQPTYIVQKYTSTGLQDLPITVQVSTYKVQFRLYFLVYSEESHGIYQIKANNSLGSLTTNLTLRGPILPPKNVRAWSTSPNTMHFECTARDMFDTSSTYQIYVYFKSEKSLWGQSGFRFFTSTETYTLNIFQPNTTYNFLFKAKSEYGFSAYSNLIQATTLSPGDLPQTKPPIYEPTESTSSPTTTTKSTKQPATTITSTRQPATTITSTGRSTTKLNIEAEEVSDTHKVGKPNNLTFEVGIGVGIGIGLVLLIIAVMATVIYFKSSHVKGDDILQTIQNSTREREAGDGMPQAAQNSTTESEAGRIYMNVAEDPYDKLSYTNAGLS